MVDWLFLFPDGNEVLDLIGKTLVVPVTQNYFPIQVGRHSIWSSYYKWKYFYQALYKGYPVYS